MREKTHTTENPSGSAPSELRLVPGGRPAPETPRRAAHVPPAARVKVRDRLVTRAKTRVAAGYYERPEVVERLVELLWDELYL